MMPSRSTPNLQADRESKGHTPPIYSYLQNQSGLNFSPVSNTTTSVPPRDDDSPPPAPPVRDSSTLKSVKYGPGHEKYPSWPVPAAADTPQALRMPPTGGSHRSKSWTDHTNYPKEKIVAYARPYMKRQHTAMQQKLKTVMERCEKLPAETYESRLNKINDHMFLPRVDRDGKSFGDMEYSVPSPPEREFCKPQLTQADLEKYARSYQDPSIENYYNEDSKGPHTHLTQADLEEYTKTYDEPFTPQHHKQASYAQSEGYHSYVSSTDSTSTPFLDRLRRDSQAVTSRAQSTGSWDELSEQENSSSKREGRDSVVTTGSSSGSSSETLKWHGSISDVSIASSTCTHSAGSINPSASRQLIAHSARVKTPQKHNSESVLYIGSDNQDNWAEREKRINNANKLKLFPVNTYTMEPSEKQQEYNQRLSAISSPSSVAEKINELEKQQKYSYLDPNKRHKVPDPTLKAIQKKALLSFYERHHSHTTTKTNIWRSEPQLAHSQPTLVPVPQPPPKINIQSPSRRASCASDYASGSNSRRSSLSSPREAKQESKLITKHQHSNSCSSLSTDLLGPVIVGPSISVDDWVPQKPPERPPKNPNLRSAFPDLFERRLPSPDLPPPSPPNVTEDEVLNNDEPFPPPPPELQQEPDWHPDCNKRKIDRQSAEPQVQKINNRRLKEFDIEARKMLEGRAKPISRHSFGPYDAHYQRSQNISRSSKERNPEESYNNGQSSGEVPMLKRAYERSSVRYPCAQKLALNGTVATSEKIAVGLSEQYRAEPLKPPYSLNESKLEGLKKSSTSFSTENKGQRASFAENLIRDVPPPLQPRQMRINQSMRVRMPERRPMSNNFRVSPPNIEKIRESTTKPVCLQMTQSKASYLASRREKERIVPDSDTGIYKRTMSPNGHALPSDTVHETSKFNTTDSSWLHNRSSKEIKVIKNNSVNLSRRASMNEKANINGTLLPMQEQEEIKKPLPDVLPVEEKILPPKSLNLAVRKQQFEIHSFNKHQNKPRSPPKYESPPSSPSKSPSRNSPLMPLRTTALSPHSPNNENIQSFRGSPPRNEIIHNQNSPVKRSFQINTTRKSPDTPDSPTSKAASFSHLISSTSGSTSGTYNSATSGFSTICTSSMSNTSSSPNAYNSSSDLTKSPQRHSPPPLRQSISVNSIKTIKNVSPLGRASPMISTSTNTPLHMSPNASPPSILTTSSSPVEREVETPKVIEGLQMIQRTEVILRVNVCTTDAASQTDKEELPPTPLPTRKKLKEEIECEKLSQDLILQLPHTDRLKHLLVPGPEHKKPTDYVTGLFRPEVTCRPKSTNSHFRNRNSTADSSSSSVGSSSNSSSPTYKNGESPLSSCVPVIEPTSPLSATSTYFTTSEPKAKLLTRYSQDMNQCNVTKDTKDLNQKKAELMNRLDKKLEVLRSEQLVVSEECRINDQLGENVEAHISRVARPHEASKFRLHIEEVGKITSLLLGLSGRLARAENALMGMPDDHSEKKTLESKRDKLLEQLEEAKKLKECIDKRSVNVSNILYKYLDSEEYADYDHFINMKAKLIMDAREIADKIKLGEEQLDALKETLNTTD